MEILKQACGVEISMDKLDLRYGTLDSELNVVFHSTTSFTNTPDGFQALLKWADEQKRSNELPILFVMEATGVYYENLAYFLSEHQQKVAVILPNKTKNFAGTLEKKSKTDLLDRDMLTRFALERKLESWKFPAEIMRKLKVLTREYHSIKDLITQAKNRLHALEHSYDPPKEAMRIIKEQIDFFTRQSKTIEKKIRALVQKDKDFNDKINRIDKIEGIGLMTIVSVLAETDCFSLVLNLKQLASYAGLDVRQRESGTLKGKSTISKMGNSHLRLSLYMPALTAIRRNPKMKEFYLRLRAKGKPHKLAHIAVARKLLLLICTLWKKNAEYVSNYQPAAKAVVS